MKSIDVHAYELYEAIGRAFVRLDPWMQVSDWLHLAAGLALVEYNSRHDVTPMYCEGTGEWNDLRDAVRSEYLLHATRLLYLCCAIESAVRQLCGKKAARSPGGVVGAICANLSAAPVAHPMGYEEVAWQIAVTGRSDPRFKSRVIQAANLPFHAAGVFLAYEVRNQLAHGTVQLPDAGDQEDGQLARQVSLVDLSSRAVLLTLQMMILSYLDAPNVELDDDYGDDDDTDASHRNRIAKLHLDLVHPRRARRVDRPRADV
ncbi:MAG TPA: hypothetical protein VGL81_31605 [Polyangiaceae bacterium]